MKSSVLCQTFVWFIYYIYAESTTQKKLTKHHLKFKTRFKAGLGKTVAPRVKHIDGSQYK